MMTTRSLSRATLVVIASLGFLTSGYASEFSEHLRNDPTAIPRPKSTIGPMDSEVTRSLRTPGEVDVYATPICSYDTFYWNTIYACDPAHQGRQDFENRGSDREISSPN